MTTFSVVIPTYNRRDYLMACLDSVQSQRHAVREVIVVDDGSSDGTVEALKGRAGTIVIQQKNAGPGAARNTGAAAATGAYVAFLDSDDLWFPWSLATMAQLIEKHMRPSLLFARFEDFSGSAPAIVPTEMRAEGRSYSDFLAAAADGAFAGAGMMVVAREVFAAAGGFSEDGQNAEDHDLALRLGTARGFVQVTQPVTTAHRIHGSNQMGDVRRNVKGVQQLVDVERRGGYPGGRARRAARRSIIARHARAAILSGLRGGASVEAFSLYGRTFAWQLHEQRLSFLLAAPVLGVRSMLMAPHAP
ncbi:MAG: glycosyltransferase [Pseudomonadota bacterium]